MPKTEPSEPSDRDLYAAFAGDSVDVGSRHLLATVLERTVGLGSEAIEFGRFELGRKLGAGGMGVVYEAHDPVLERKIALKVLRRRTGDQLRVALQEAELMAGVVHDNIVHVHEVGMDEGQAWIVMELVEGTTLRRWQRESNASWRQLLDVYVRAGRGLAAAHERGLVHGDFKPDNVLVGGEGEVPRVVKVTDFGLAHGGQGEGRLGGTPEYMAPEQLREGARDQRSEQFSFCVALFEVLAGVHPYSRWSLEELTFTVRSEDPDASEVTIRQRYCRELAVNMARGDLRWPRRPIRIPRRLKRALERGLAVEPERRFGSMGELLEAIDLRQARRVRVRWSAAAGVGVAVGLGAAQWVAAAQRAADEDRRTKECGAPEERFAEVWDEDAWTKLEVAHPEAVGELRLTLARYGDRWAEAYRDACNDTVGHGEWAAWGPARECFDLRLSAVQAVVDDLEEAEQPLRMIGGLVSRSPYACALDTSGAPGPADGTEDELASVQEKLASAFADEVAQEYSRGLATMEEVIEDARQLDYEPLLAESYLQRGRLRIQQAIYDDMTAREWDVPGMDDVDRAELIAGDSSARSVLTDAWIFRRKALAVLGAPEQLGEDDAWEESELAELHPDQRAEWLEVLGLRSYNRALRTPEDQGKEQFLARALARYDAALALRRDIGDEVGRAKLLENKGHVLVARKDHAQALAQYHEAVEFWRARGAGSYLPTFYASQINATMMDDNPWSLRLADDALGMLTDDPEGRLVVLMAAIPAAWGKPIALDYAEQAMVALAAGTDVDSLHEVQVRILALGALVRSPAAAGRPDDVEEWSKRLEADLEGRLASSFASLPPDLRAIAWSYLGRAYLLRGSLEHARVALLRARGEAASTDFDDYEQAELELDLGETLLELSELDAAGQARERAQQQLDALVASNGQDEPPIPALRERLQRQRAQALALAREG